MPKTRTDWWAAKFAANAARDARNQVSLTEAGWEVLVLWECELSGTDLGHRIRTFLERANRTVSVSQQAEAVPLTCEVVTPPQAKRCV